MYYLTKITRNNLKNRNALNNKKNNSQSKVKFHNLLSNVKEKRFLTMLSKLISIMRKKII